MGMYDELMCDFPLKQIHKKYQGETFQTKSFANVLDKYFITKQGELYCKKSNWFPGEDSNGEKLKISLNKKKKMKYTGEVGFYHWDTKQDFWIEYSAFFAEGKLIYLQHISEEKL